MAPPARRVLFAAVAVSLGLGGLEGGAWLYEVVAAPPPRRYPTPEPQGPPPGSPRAAVPDGDLRPGIPMVPDPQLRWRLAPGLLRSGPAAYHINALGLRGAELPPAPPARELRLLTLGDSSIFGLGIAEPEVLSQVAAAELARRLRRPVRGVNGGVPGYDSGQSLALLRRVGRLVAPAVVVVANLWSDIYVNDRARSVRINRAHLLGPLARGSALYRVARGALAPLLRPIRVRFITSRQDVGAVRGGPPTRVPLARYAANLDQLAREARALGALPAFLTLPAPMDLDARPPPEAVQEFREAMAQVARRHGAPLLDGVAVLRAHREEPGWFMDQVHPLPRGHHLLGQALARLLAPRLAARGAAASAPRPPDQR